MGTEPSGAIDDCDCDNCEILRLQYKIQMLKQQNHELEHETARDKLADYEYPSDNQPDEKGNKDEILGSHWEGCWRAHHKCAVARIERLEQELSKRDDKIAQLEASVTHACGSDIWLRRDGEVFGLHEYY